MLSNVRTTEAAEAFFRDAVAQPAVQWPSTINVDGYSATRQGLSRLGHAEPRWKGVKVRANRYVNNLIEQDHRAVKRRCAAMHGLKSFGTAAIVLSGVELAHRIRKGQFNVRGGECPRPSLKDVWQSALRHSTIRQPATEEGMPPTHHFSADYVPHRIRRGQRRGLRRHTVRIPYGQGLYLQLMPNGGCYWRYRYRWEGRENMLALGVYPTVPVATARQRHASARQLLATGVDPASRRRALRGLCDAA